MNRYSLKKRILRLNIALSILPLLIIGSIVYVLFTSNIRERMYELLQGASNQIDLSLNILLNDIDRFCEIRNQPEVIRFLKNSEIETELFVADAKDLLELIEVYKDNTRFSQGIKDIVFWGNNSKGYSAKTGVFFHDEEIFGKNYSIESYNDIQIFRTEETDHSGSSIERLVVQKEIYHPVTLEQLGQVRIYLDEVVIEQYLGSVFLEGLRFFILIDRALNVLYVSDYREHPEINAVLLSRIIQEKDEQFVTVIDNEAHFVVTNTPAFEYTTVMFANQKEVMEDLRRVLKIFISVLILEIYLIIFLSRLLTENLTNPIIELRKAMRKVESGDLSIQATTEGGEEITGLTNSFNTMINRMNHLIKKNEEEHELRLRSEFNLLQEQINPHFLYNTLDTIMWKAEGGDTEDVKAVVESLSAFFRGSLSGGNEIIQVREEINHVQNYLIIMSYRYEDILTFSLNVDEKLLDRYLLKLILQPLVENAIYHGIKQKRGGGRLSLKGELIGNLICFSVSDTGVGIPKEKLMKILESFKKKESFSLEQKKGFGLLNVYRRLKLYYGDEAGLTIESRDGIGTTINVNLPLREISEFHV
ncbi:MAG: hypothetical protein B6241_09750 [Spirochaetaceae bacterium 4572_59]|nr:MAG: hypothetical protein B6241_09750 [Spirochaetaceae bacterium 4572_59]